MTTARTETNVEATDGRQTRRRGQRGRARLAVVGALAVVAAVALAGCTGANDGLAKQYGNGTTQNYISGNGAVTEVSAKDRKAPVSFTAEDLDGETLSAKELRGKVVVLNFWYASCPPCRAEAKSLNTVHDRFEGKDVAFIGVNVRDERATAKAFERTFGTDYPTVLDARSGAMQLALSGNIAPNAVPATIVLDQQGRVAARILGAIDGPSILSTLVSDELEGTSGGAS